MKNLFKTLPALLVAVIMAAVTSCSDSKTSELLSIAGDDAEGVVLFNPVELLKNAGAQVEGGNLVLPRGLRRNMGGTIGDLLKVRGIDYERGILVGYDKFAVIAVVVKDADELVSSLKKIGCEKIKAGSRTAYYTDEDNLVFVIENNMLVAADCRYSDDAGDRVEEIFDEASTPLASWKTDMLSSRGSRTVYGIVIPPVRKLDAAFAFSVSLSGAKATLEAEMRDQNGKEVSVSDLVGVELAPVGDMMKEISDKSLLSFAFGGLSDSNVAKMLDKFDISPRQAGLSGIDESYLRMLSGGVFGAVDLSDRSSRRYDNFKNYQVVVGLRAVEGRGSRLLSESIDMMRDQDMPVRADGDGYILKTPLGDVSYKADGDLLVCSTEERPGGSGMSSDDCLAFMSVDVPADLGILKELPVGRVKFGVKGFVKVYPSKAEAEIELVGSDKPFLAALIELSRD